MNPTKVHKFKKCRACGCRNLRSFLHLPQMPFTDDFIAPSRFGEEFRADLEVFICIKCLTAQTQHDVDVGEYYEDYQYSVGGSATATRFMNLLAKNLKDTYYPNSNGRKVLEVGSGDGEQLVAFKNTGCNVLGYEPSSTLCQVSESKGVPTIQGLFTAKSIDQLPIDFREVDMVMLSYTFDHLPSPREFLAVVRSILNPLDGILIVEIHNFEKIIDRREYCLFEHEHSIYLTEQTAQEMCRREGFEIINFEIVPETNRRANSLIFVATPSNSRLADRAVSARTPKEFSNIHFYEQVGAQICDSIANLDKYVDTLTRKGKKIAGYGAGGRGVMSLAAMGNSSKVSYLVDKKPKCKGLVVPKSGIPLFGIDILRDSPVDEIIVFSFGYMAEIQAEISPLGYCHKQFRSLLDILAGRF